MKKTLLFSVALAGLMLGSCSSSDDLNGGGTGNPSFNKDGNGFMSISVNLPTRTGNTTRAENDKYEDGLSSEYEVKNGTILIFDNSGKFVEKAELGTMNPWTDIKNNGVTTAAIATVKLEKVALGENKYKALVDMLTSPIQRWYDTPSLPLEVIITGIDFTHTKMGNQRVNVNLTFCPASRKHQVFDRYSFGGGIFDYTFDRTFE